MKVFRCYIGNLASLRANAFHMPLDGQTTYLAFTNRTFDSASGFEVSIERTPDSKFSTNKSDFKRERFGPVLFTTPAIFELLQSSASNAEGKCEAI